MQQYMQLPVCKPAHRTQSELEPDALYSIGEIPGPDGEYVSNPLTFEEVKRLAEAGKSYSPTYQKMLGYLRENSQS